MRSVLSGLFTVVAIVCMIVAVPSFWVSQRVVSTDGFAASAAEAARNTEVQDYFADKISTSVAENVRVDSASALVHPLAEKYTRSDDFVTDFEEIARQQHDWLFTAPGPDTDPHVMDVNITPMVNRVIGQAHLPFPVNLDRPIYVGIDQHRLSAGSLESTGTFVDSVAWITVVGAAVAAILALLAARRRGTVLAWLGLGGVLAGVGAYLIALYIRSLAGDKASDTDEAARRTVEVVADGVSSDLVQWALITGGAGALVAVAGIILRAVGGGRRTAAYAY